jgi:hypothetical protein
MNSILKPQNPSEFPLGTPYPVTPAQRDTLKRDHPVQYAEMLELVIAGKVVITNEPEVR